MFPKKPEIFIPQLYLFNFLLGVSMATNTSLPGGGSISADTSAVRLVLLSSGHTPADASRGPRRTPSWTDAHAERERARASLPGASRRHGPRWPWQRALISTPIVPSQRERHDSGPQTHEGGGSEVRAPLQHACGLNSEQEAAQMLQKRPLSISDSPSIFSTRLQ